MQDILAPCFAYQDIVKVVAASESHFLHVGVEGVAGEEIVEVEETAESHIP